MTRAELGYTGERLIVRLLRHFQWFAVRGGVADILAVNPQGLLVDIEVKTAQRGKDGKWRFTLYKQGSQDHRKSDYVILVALAYEGSALFVIPTRDVLDRTFVCITSNPKTYAGKFAKYRI